MLIESLNKGTDFNRVRRFGKKEKYKFVTLSILSTQNEHFRLGFQISKKIGKNSVAEKWNNDATNKKQALFISCLWE